MSPRAPLTGSSELATHLFFAATIFVGATLLFACQPIVARMVVPLLGGSPSVWIVCSLCFQVILLAGYGYAHFVGTRLPLRAQVALQLALVAAVFFVMPVAVDEATAERLTSSHPTLGLCILLLRTIGLPFFVLSTSSPLLQRWFAEVGDRDPYHLYAASNAGSMLALLGYPFLVEPVLAVRAQARGLHVAFACYAVLLVICAGTALRRPSRRALAPSESTPAPPQVRVTLTSLATVAEAAPAAERWRERVVWLALAFAPSSLLLGATDYVTTEVASVPLLWVLPLALYLLSFIVAFAKKQVVRERVWSYALALAGVSVTLLTVLRVARPHWLLAGAHMLLLFFASVVCHRALAVRRPHVSRLTEFYLLLSIGGVLGALFNGIVAPSVFDDLYEYPLAIALAFLGRAAFEQTKRARARELVVAFVIGGALIGAMRFGGHVGKTLWADRGFFGVLKVTRDVDGRYRQLLSGRALHGQQAIDPAGAGIPLAAYHPTGPAGDVLGPLPSRELRLPTRGVGVIGLGIGSLAAYARAGDEWTFFELNPKVVDVARQQFTYVAAAEERAKIRIEVGDARLRLRDGDPRRFDVLVLDAFSSDAVPVHLLTREALAVYRRALRPGGLLLVHITNEHVRLEPVLGALARGQGMVAVSRRDLDVDQARAPGKVASEWVVLTETRAELDLLLRVHDAWRPTVVPAGQAVWTDDYADVLGALRF